MYEELSDNDLDDELLEHDLPEKKTRHCELTLAEKFEIYQFVNENPDVIGAQVARMFSEKFQKHLNNKIVYRIRKKGNFPLNKNLRKKILT